MRAGRLHQAGPEDPVDSKTAVFILSTMRSGSTLLKALLAEAPDVSNLPEVDFQKLRRRDVRQKLSELAPEPIVVLKRPAWFHEASSYPKLPPVGNRKFIVLTRDVHHNVASIRKMVFRTWASHIPDWVDHWFGEGYWARVYRLLHNRFEDGDPNVTWLRYEDLVAEPIRETKRLFDFMGSRQEHGIDSYSPPDGYEWKWGSDDGGPKIQSLRVQPPKPHTPELESMLTRLLRNKRIAQLRAQLGY